MKKTLLVTAVAAAISGNAIAAEMYGQVRLGLSTYQTPATVGPGDLGVDELDVNSSKSSVHFKRAQSHTPACCGLVFSLLTLRNQTVKSNRNWKKKGANDLCFADVLFPPDRVLPANPGNST